MDSALDILTDEIVEAESLWLLEEVNPDRYVCRGCGAKATPASYRPENVPRPYFRAKHVDGCDIEGEEKLISKGKKGKLGEQLDSHPALCPSKLILREYRSTTETDDGLQPTTLDSRSHSHSNTSTESDRPERRREANTIRPICRAFIRFPHDRYRNLEIDGIAGKNYLSAFKRLSWSTIEKYPKTKIFYAELAWKPIKSSDELIEIPLAAGERDESKRLTKGYTIKIDWTDWSKHKKTSVRKELESAKKEAQDSKRDGKRDRAYVFFMGTQNAQSPNIFRVYDHRLICCLVDEITYPVFD